MLVLVKGGGVLNFGFVGVGGFCGGEGVFLFFVFVDFLGVGGGGGVEDLFVFFGFLLFGGGGGGGGFECLVLWLFGVVGGGGGGVCKVVDFIFDWVFCCFLCRKLMMNF